MSLDRGEELTWRHTNLSNILQSCDVNVTSEDRCVGTYSQIIYQTADFLPQNGLYSQRSFQKSPVYVCVKNKGFIFQINSETMNVENYSKNDKIIKIIYFLYG